MINYITKVLAVINQKGGVGKTTVTTCLGEYGGLIYEYVDWQNVKKSPSILLIDLDLQANLSDYFVGMEIAPNARGGQLPPRHPDCVGLEDYEERSTIADAFYGKEIMPFEVEIKSNNRTAMIDVITAHPEKLELINEQFDKDSGEIDKRVVNHLAKLLHDPDVASAYDLVIIDTAPTRTPLFRAALRAATHVLVPYIPEPKSLQGVNSMSQAIRSENMNRIEEDAIKVVGMLPTKVRIGTKLHKTQIERVRKYLPDMCTPFDVHVPLSTAYPSTDAEDANPISIFQHRPSDKIRKKTEHFCKYILDQIFNQKASSKLAQKKVG